MNETYQNLQVCFGDLHNHCGLSYGRGTLAEALHNARLQLDFASVTPHALWPDMPVDDPRLDYLVAYHQYGFRAAAENWPGYLEAIEAANQPGRFVTFPSYEWHACAYGDHCIYYKEGRGQTILDAPDLPSLRRKLAALTTPAMLIPHHIGYKQGFRGINWDAFSEQLSPVVEIFSFHGCSESSTGPYPYLHSMGPRDVGSCAQAGWAAGHCFGVIGSTDHHSAFPGSYGSGCMGVWAEALTRDAIWQAITQRRTYALTGDRILLKVTLNGQPMGAVCPPNPVRQIAVAVSGGDAIDMIEVLLNNRIIHRESPLPPRAENEGRYKIHLEAGWGESSKPTPWDMAVGVSGGKLLSVEPRFRGRIGDRTPPDGNYADTDWSQTGPNRIHFTTRTQPNPTPLTPAAQGLCLEVEGDDRTHLWAEIGGEKYEHRLADLMDGARTHYLGGFVSPAICFHRAVPAAAFEHEMRVTHQRPVPKGRDWYTVRVRQRNEQWAWSSPIWIGK